MAKRLRRAVVIRRDVPLASPSRWRRLEQRQLSRRDLPSHRRASRRRPAAQDESTTARPRRSPPAACDARPSPIRRRQPALSPGPPATRWKRTADAGLIPHRPPVVQPRSRIRSDLVGQASRSLTHLSPANVPMSRPECVGVNQRSIWFEPSTAHLKEAPLTRGFSLGERRGRESCRDLASPVCARSCPIGGAGQVDSGLTHRIADAHGRRHRAHRERPRPRAAGVAAAESSAGPVLRQGPEGSPLLSPHPQRVCRYNPMRCVPLRQRAFLFRALSGGYNVQRAAGAKANPKGGSSCRGAARRPSAAGLSPRELREVKRPDAGSPGKLGRPCVPRGRTTPGPWL
jgi:hypothetical protein